MQVMNDMLLQKKDRLRRYQATQRNLDLPNQAFRDAIMRNSPHIFGVAPQHANQAKAQKEAENKQVKAEVDVEAKEPNLIEPE
jgi:hypothetical protein